MCFCFHDSRLFLINVIMADHSLRSQIMHRQTQDSVSIFLHHSVSFLIIRCLNHSPSFCIILVYIFVFVQCSFLIWSHSFGTCLFHNMVVFVQSVFSYIWLNSCGMCIRATFFFNIVVFVRCLFFDIVVFVHSVFYILENVRYLLFI